MTPLLRARVLSALLDYARLERDQGARVAVMRRALMHAQILGDRSAERAIYLSLHIPELHLTTGDTDAHTEHSARNPH